LLDDEKCQRARLRALLNLSSKSGQLQLVAYSALQDHHHRLICLSVSGTKSEFRHLFQRVWSASRSTSDSCLVQH